MRCRICSNESKNIPYEVREMMNGGKEKFQYFQCSNCRCLQISEVPYDISKYYSINYYSYENKSHLHKPEGFTEISKRYLVNKRNYFAVFNKGLFGRLLYILQPNLELKSLSKLSLSTNSTILDVGCGVGAHLYFLKELGFENIIGIDPYVEKDIEHDNGLKIFKQDISSIKSKWDIIMYHHSFEHIMDPLAELKQIYELLLDGGTCIIRTPTVSSYAWKFYKTNWIQLDAPRHYFLYSIETIGSKSQSKIRTILL